MLELTKQWLTSAVVATIFLHMTFGSVPSVDISLPNGEQVVLLQSVGGELHAEDGEVPLYVGVDCSGTAAAWVSVRLAAAVALIAGAAWLLRTLKWLWKTTPLGIAVSAAVSFVSGFLAGLGIGFFAISVFHINECHTVRLSDFI